MWLIRPLVSDPRLQLVGFLIVAMLLFAGIFGQRNVTPCVSCSGHQESAQGCLCYHAPSSPESSRR